MAKEISKDKENIKKISNKRLLYEIFNNFGYEL